jgi:hypothetical protein
MGTAEPDHDLAINRAEFENGTDPFKADTDGDGQLDGVEITYGSDPLNPNETAATASVPAAGSLSLCMAALALGIGGAYGCRKK